jgi:hypothetical protein
MDVSIYNSVRGNKVTTGNAAQYQGMRTFDNTAQVCPPRSNVSDYGVAGVSRDSINTYTAGCFDPMDRMEVENIQRPRYATYLNAAAISSPGVGDDDYGTVDFQYGASKPYYDTQLGNQYVRPIESRDQMFPEYKVGQLQLNKGVTDNAQLREANYVNCMMSREGEQRYCDANKSK